ncbi:MAG TPA: hypothetical protein VGM08_01805 [Candidatus Saccharimonadales bacterium]|jgi:hypothetical protein
MAQDDQSQSPLWGQPRPRGKLARLAREISFTPQKPGYITIEVLGINRDDRLV